MAAGPRCLSDFRGARLSQRESTARDKWNYFSGPQRQLCCRRVSRSSPSSAHAFLVRQTSPRRKGLGLRLLVVVLVSPSTQLDSYHFRDPVGQVLAKHPGPIGFRQVGSTSQAHRGSSSSVQRVSHRSSFEACKRDTLLAPYFLRLLPRSGTFWEHCSSL